MNHLSLALLSPSDQTDKTQPKETNLCLREVRQYLGITTVSRLRRHARHARHARHVIDSPQPFRHFKTTSSALCTYDVRMKRRDHLHGPLLELEANRTKENTTQARFQCIHLFFTYCSAHMNKDVVPIAFQSSHNFVLQEQALQRHFLPITK
jgi:hypothetical protein